MKNERLQMSIQTVKENIEILESQEPEDAGYYLQLEHEKMVLEALEKQIPKKPYTDNDNGIYEKEYCPTCHRSLFPNDHHCKCGQALIWEDHDVSKNALFCQYCGSKLTADVKGGAER